MQRRLKSSMPRKRSPSGRPEVVSRGVTRADIQDGVPHPKQNKTGEKLAIEITGELAQMIERITSRPAKIKGTSLIQGESGQLRDDGAGSWAISIVQNML